MPTTEAAAFTGSETSSAAPAKFCFDQAFEEAESQERAQRGYEVLGRADWHNLGLGERGFLLVADRWLDGSIPPYLRFCLEA